MANFLGFNKYYYPSIPKDLFEMKTELARMEANEERFFNSLKTVPGQPKIDVYFSIEGVIASLERGEVATQSVDYILHNLEREDV